MLDCAKSCEFMENIVIFSEDAKCVTPTQRLLRKVAILLSVAFHPMMMPIYAMMYILYGNQLWSALPAACKTTMILYICIPTSVVPLAMLALMVMFGFVGDPEMPNKSERILPITVSATLIAIACFVMHNVVELPLPMIRLVEGMFIMLLLAGLVTPFWKISLHAIGVGALIAYVSIVGIMSMSDFSMAASVAFALSGLVAWSRLYLESHTPLQLLMGFVVGCLSMTIAMLHV